MKTKKKNWWYLWRYVLLGMLVGILLGALLVTLAFTLPVSAPIVGGLAAAALYVTAQFGFWGAVGSAAGVVLGLGIVSGGLGKIVEFAVDGLRNLSGFGKKNKVPVIAAPAKPLSPISIGSPPVPALSTSPKALSKATPPHTPRNIKSAASSSESYTSRLSTSTSSSSSSALVTTQLTPLPSPSRTSRAASTEILSANVTEIFSELEKVDLSKERGRIEELRARLVDLSKEEAKASEILTAVKSNSAKAYAQFDAELDDKKTLAEVEKIIDKSFVKKVRFVFHPDKFPHPLANEVTQWLNGWWNNTKKLMERKLSKDVGDVVSRKLDEEIREVREGIERLSAALKRLGEGIDRMDAAQQRVGEGIARLDAGTQEVATGLKELTATRQDTMTRLAGIDEKARAFHAWADDVLEKPADQSPPLLPRQGKS